MGTLMHERGTFGAGLQVTYKRNFNRLVEIAHEMKRDSDPLVRQKLAQAYTEIEVMRCNQMRAFSKINETGVPGPEGSIQKIFWSELNQRFQQIGDGNHGAVRAAGARLGRCVRRGPVGLRISAQPRQHHRSRDVEIQRNIIGHFVLGLPKSY